MTENVSNLESLKNVSFCIPEGKLTQITWAPGASYIFEAKGFSENTYCDADNVVSFYHDKALYIIPSTKKIFSILRENGFEWKPMSVPFAHGAYPTWHKHRWKSMLMKARQERLKEENSG